MILSVLKVFYVEVIQVQLLVDNRSKSHLAGQLLNSIHYARTHKKKRQPLSNAAVTKAPGYIR